MAIEDLIANPQQANIAQAVYGGKDDAQAAKDAKLQHMIKQLGYREALKDIQLNDMKRTLDTGATRFALGKQKERQARDYKQEEIDAEFKMDEQIIRGINNPRTYKRWADTGMLPKDFYDETGNALPYEKTAKQRSAMYGRAVDSAPHLRAKELAGIRASANTEGYTAADVTRPQLLSAFTAIKKKIKANKWKMGNIDGEEPETDSDAFRLSMSVAELTAQVATQKAKLTGKAPNESQIQEEILAIAEKHKIKNPANEQYGKYDPRRLMENDDSINWDGFYSDVNKKFKTSAAPGGSGTPSVSVSVPMFVLQNGEEVSQEDIEFTAQQNNMTPEEVIKQLGAQPIEE